MDYSFKTRVESHFPEFITRTRARSEAAVELTAKLIEVGAKGRVPVQSGDLKESIQVQDGDSPLSKKVVAGGKAYYAHFVEFGTSKMPAEPFLIPAAEDARDEMNRILRSTLR